MMQRRRFLAGLAAAPLLTGPARADKYPNRPVRVLVGFAAGGITDLTARALVEAMTPALGQTMVVENKSGAGGNIASAELARTTPDGYTVMLASPGQLVVNPMTQSSIGFDPNTRFSLIGLTSISPFVMVVPTASPFRSAADLIAFGKANPGKLTFASPGIGTTMHIGGEMLNAFTGIGAVHVPYRGGAQSTADLVAGRVDFMIDSLGATSNMIKGGQLRVIAATGPRRLPQFPDIAAMAESLPDFELSSWLGLVGPPQLPADVIETLTSSLARAVRSPRFTEFIEQRGSAVADPSPGFFTEHLRRERERVERTIVKSGLKLG